MQCYENQMMLIHLYSIMGYIDADTDHDELIMNDILSESGVDNIIELLKIDNSVIKQIALHYLTPFHQAA